MRDVNRIKPILNELERIWMEVPDERFWQFMINLSGRVGFGLRDPFFVDDDEALKQLQEIWPRKSL
jgi:hypothetical protein